MTPWEKFRRFMFGPSAVPPPRSRWAEPEKVEQVVLPKQSFLLKFRRFIGVFLVINVGIGGYMISRTTPKSNKKHRGNRKDASSQNAALAPPPPPPPPAPVHHRKVTTNEQRQLFQWMLDEKRRLKPATPQEKARIDEDKKVLKQFLRATNIPPI